MSNGCGGWPTPGRETPCGGPPEEWRGTEKLELDALTEFKRGSNGVVELKFVDRGRLLERLLDAVDHSGEDQVDRFLQAMEGEG